MSSAVIFMSVGTPGVIALYFLQLFLGLAKLRKQAKTKRPSTAKFADCSPSFPSLTPKLFLFHRAHSESKSEHRLVHSAPSGHHILWANQACRASGSCILDIWLALLMLGYGGPSCSNLRIVDSLTGPLFPINLGSALRGRCKTIRSVRCEIPRPKQQVALTPGLEENGPSWNNFPRKGCPILTTIQICKVGNKQKNNPSGLMHEPYDGSCIGIYYLRWFPGIISSAGITGGNAGRI